MTSDPHASGPVPFNPEKLENLMDEAGIDVLLANSRHNVRYLTGYYYHFKEQVTAGGNSRYVPFVGIPRGRIDASFYVGNAGEALGLKENPIWIRQQDLSAGDAGPSAEAAAALAERLTTAGATIGVEMPFLPAASFVTLQRALPHARLVDATDMLHELRAIKTPAELETMRLVCDGVAESIVAAFKAGHPGITTRQMSEHVQQQMADRGLNFLWSFTCAGPSMLRNPSEATWDSGQVLHLDCGGEVDDYLADICRMGCLGEPSAAANDLYLACIDLQNQARQWLKPGVLCSDLYQEGQAALRKSPHAEFGHFVVHAVGMVSHEHPVIDAQNKRPLEPGMVMSVETDFRHPDVGYIKIEDTVAITAGGSVGLGDAGRDWQIV